METIPQNTSVVNQLSVSERSAFSELEGVIERGLANFIEVGEALAKIAAERLYRDTYSPFEDYCQERWGFSRQRARQLMEASSVALDLTTNGLHLENERQARLVGRIKDKGERRRVVEEAIAVRGKVSPKKLQAAVEKRLQVEEKKPPERTAWTAPAVTEWKEALLRLPEKIRDGVAELICQPGVGPDHAIRLARQFERTVFQVRSEVLQAFRALGRD